MVTICMYYLIHSFILHNSPPEPVLSWEFCYIYFLCRSDYATATELYLCFYSNVCVLYNGVCIDLFAYIIQYNCWLYFILGVLSYISTIHGLLFHYIVVTFTIVLICLWMLYLCLLRYVDVVYRKCFWIIIHIGKLAIHIYCI